MRRQVVSDDEVYKKLRETGVTTGLPASRVSVAYSMLVVDVSALPPKAGEYLGLQAGYSAERLGIPAYVMYSPVRSDHDMYRRLGTLLSGALPRGAVRESAGYAVTPWGLHIGIAEPLGHPEVEHLAGVMADYVRLSGTPRPPLRFVLVTPDGYALREFGELPLGASVLCGHVIEVPPAITLDSSAVDKYCTMLRSPGVDGMDALDVIRMLDTLRGGTEI